MHYVGNGSILAVVKCLLATSEGFHRSTAAMGLSFLVSEFRLVLSIAIGFSLVNCTDISSCQWPPFAHGSIRRIQSVAYAGLKGANICSSAPWMICESRCLPPIDHYRRIFAIDCQCIDYIQILYSNIPFHSRQDILSRTAKELLRLCTVARTISPSR